MSAPAGSPFDYRPRSEGELAALPEDALLDHIVGAREAGDLEGARTAAGILAFSFEPVIRNWVRRDMGSQGPEAVEDVVMDVLASVIHSSFDGKVIGQFGSMLRLIAQRRVVDYFRRAERHGRDVPLPEEGEGEEGHRGDPIGREDEHHIELHDAAQRVLARRNELHARVIRLYGPDYLGFEGRSAAETAAEIDAEPGDATVTEPNIHQIWKRFKTELAEELDLHG